MSHYVAREVFLFKWTVILLLLVAAGFITKGEFLFVAVCIAAIAAIVILFRCLVAILVLITAYIAGEIDHAIWQYWFRKEEKQLGIAVDRRRWRRRKSTEQLVKEEVERSIRARQLSH